MTRFIDLSSKSDSTFIQVLATVLLVIFIFLLAGMGLNTDYRLNGIESASENVGVPEYILALGSNRVFFWLLFPFFLVFIVFLASIKWIHRRPILTIFTKRDRFDWRRVLLSFILVFFILLITTCIQIYFSEETASEFKT